MFDGYLSFKIFNKVSKTCFHDKVWKLHLYVKPKIPKNMKIKEHFRQNVIKRVEKIPPGYPRTHIKIPGFLYIHNPGIFYSGIFQVSKSRDYLVPGYPVDIPNPVQKLLCYSLKTLAYFRTVCENLKFRANSWWVAILFSFSP